MLCMDYYFGVLDTRPWPHGATTLPGWCSGAARATGLSRCGTASVTWQASRSSSAHVGGACPALTQPSPCLDLRAPGKSVNIVDLAGLKMSDAAGEAFRFISKAGSECLARLSA